MRPKEFTFYQWYMYRYVPGGIEKATFWQGIKWNWAAFTVWAPLLVMTQRWWWRDLARDYKNGFRSCGCGRTWWDYRLKPAIFGAKRFGGGC